MTHINNSTKRYEDQAAGHNEVPTVINVVVVDLTPAGANEPQNENVPQGDQGGNNTPGAEAGGNGGEVAVAGATSGP
ncbi:hypothetical protein BGZ76_001863 [Entomortierella beljakovae]|nr:hypothetical protein BGZ76_001863 [Entomortierella beljakovae]